MQFNNGEKILKYKNLHYVVIVLEDIYQHYIFKIIVNILIDLFYFLLLEQPKKQINKFKNSQRVGKIKMDIEVKYLYMWHKNYLIGILGQQE